MIRGILLDDLTAVVFMSRSSLLGIIYSFLQSREERPSDRQF